MFPFTEIFSLILQTLGQAFLDPQFWPVILLILGLVFLQYRKIGNLRESLFRRKTGRIWIDVGLSLGFGLLGGLIGSLLMVTMGLTLSIADLIYLWPVAILLMLINLRYLCFAYSGGILAVFSLIFGFPQINIPQIIALVAVLHMVESLLILFSGHLGATPAFIKIAGGRVVGGFALQRFWPIPLVVLAAVSTGMAQYGTELLGMPDWWPLLETQSALQPVQLQELAIVLLPVLAALGYSDVSITKSPPEKSRLAALHLALYSVVLLLLAILAARNQSFLLAAALFAPLGHELVIYISKRMESDGEALYTPTPYGVRVLDVLPNLVAWRAGIRSGDVLLALNGQELLDKDSFYQMQQGAFLPSAVDYFSYSAGESRRRLLKMENGTDWGIVFVPEENESRYVEFSTTGLLGRWLGSLRGKFQR